MSDGVIPQTDKLWKSLILQLFLGAVFASIVVLTGFALFSFLIGEYYLKIVGSLVHKNQEENRALLFIFSQTCALGGAGGYLRVLNIIIEYATKGLSNNRIFSSAFSDRERVLMGFIITLRGVIAGAMVGTISGGILFVIGRMEAIANAHLLVLGVSCLAGFNDRVFNQIVRIGARHSTST
jgi:hypothetical protein